MTLTLSDRVTSRLDSDHIIWLTTVDVDHAPIPTPIWFVWNNGQFYFFTEPGKAKIRNIASNPTVALHLNSNASGGDVAVFTGQGHIDEHGPTDAEWDVYTAKYASSFPAIGTTASAFRDTYSVLVRVDAQRLRSW